MIYKVEMIRNCIEVLGKTCKFAASSTKCPLSCVTSNLHKKRNKCMYHNFVGI